MREDVYWLTIFATRDLPDQFEAVHAIQGWSDLHRRLEADRRCFAFFHPSLPGEPIIFIEAELGL